MFGPTVVPNMPAHDDFHDHVMAYLTGESQSGPPEAYSRPLRYRPSILMKLPAASRPVLSERSPKECDCPSTWQFFRFIGTFKIKPPFAVFGKYGHGQSLLCANASRSANRQTQLTGAG